MRILILLLLSSSLHAQSLQSLLSAPAEVDKLVTPVQGQECSEADPCVDLFQASCTDSSGKFKTDFDVTKEMEKKIDFAREAAIKAMGKESFEKAYFEFLGQRGFVVKAGIDEEKKREILTGEAYLKDGLSESFEGFHKSCFDLPRSEIPAKIEAAKTELQKLKILVGQKKISVEYATEQTKAKATEEYETASRDHQSQQSLLLELLEESNQEARSQAEEFNEKVRKTMLERPERFVTDILRLCSALNEGLPKAKELAPKEAAAAAPEQYGRRIANPKLLSAKLPEVCSQKNLFELRNSMVKTLVKKDPVGRKSEVTKFIDAHFKSYLVVKDIEEALLQKTIYMSNYEEADSPIKQHEDRLRETQQARTLSCRNQQQVGQEEFRDLFEEFNENIAKSKPVVETIITTLYTDDLKSKIDSLYGPSHTSIMRFVKDDLSKFPTLADQVKIKEMSSQLEGLSFFWPEKPDPGLYKKSDAFPLEVLDEDKLPVTDMFYRNFFDPKLSFFSSLNAFYTPVTKVGVHVGEEKVFLMPTLNLMAEKSPYDVMATIAHEIGHKLGPEVSRINGYDLRGEYKELLMCLSGADSIGMNQNQSDEAFSDWLSAKVVGEGILKLPTPERRAAALSVAGFFCQAHMGDFFSSSFSLKNKHPESTLRINGIYGANKQIREALDCKGPGPYRECQLRDAQ